VSGREVRSPGIGRVIEILVEVGARVDAGQELMVIESMKMEIPITAERAGVVAAIRVAAGEHVQERDLLVVLTG
jgi:biotin carboxyl carrier protein